MFVLRTNLAKVAQQNKHVISSNLCTPYECGIGFLSEINWVRNSVLSVEHCKNVFLCSTNV